jgi:hypothetical protein
MTAKKPQPPKARPAEDEPRIGFPGDAKERPARIQAAIAANRETLRRLAK